MKRYFFGYLFVRLNKLVAILTVLAAGGFAAVLYLQTFSEAGALGYHNNDSLTLRLTKLSQIYARTSARVQSAGQLSTTAISQAQNGMPVFESSYETQSDFDRLHDELSRADEANQALKDNLISNFKTHISQIIKILQMHASEVAPSSPASYPATARAGTTTYNPQDSYDGIYAASLRQQDINERIDTLKYAQRYLSDLEDVSEKPENRQIIRASFTDITVFLNLLAAFSEEPREPAANIDPQTQASAPRKAVNSELVAARLSDLMNKVEQSVLISWAFDEAFDRASETYAAERQKCLVSGLAIKHLWLAALGSMAEIVCGGLFAAFMLLVCADLTKAILDNANSSEVVANAYRAANPEE